MPDVDLDTDERKAALQAQIAKPDTSGATDVVDESKPHNA